MRLGLSSYTYGWAVGVHGHPPVHPVDERGLFDQVRAHELKLLQIGDNLPLETFRSDRLDRLGERAEREGVELQVGARRLTTERLKLYADLSRRLNAKLLRFVIDDADYRPQREEVIQVLREAGPLLGGITLAIENHDRFAAAVLWDIITAADQPNIGVCLDTANSLGAGEGLDYILELLGPLTVNLHIKDFIVERVPSLMGFNVKGCPAGKGLVDIPKLLERLRGIGRCESAVLELWTPPESELERTIEKERAWAEESILYLERFFPAL